MTKERFSNQTVLNSNKERTAKFAPTLPPPTSKEVVTGPRTLKTSPRALKIHQNFRAAKYDINQRSDIIQNFFIKKFLTAIENERFEIYLRLFEFKLAEFFISHGGYLLNIAL